mmetsp:Transcript_47450/g.69531  ORF Transcript_47450/g.69531 Transcript_47450/m.69531 type:complete len:158 (-) Transcript_47450:152-625(-)
MYRSHPPRISITAPPAAHTRHCRASRGASPPVSSIVPYLAVYMPFGRVGTLPSSTCSQNPSSLRWAAGSTCHHHVSSATTHALMRVRLVCREGGMQGRVVARGFTTIRIDYRLQDWARGGEANEAAVRHSGRSKANLGGDYTHGLLSGHKSRDTTSR